MYICAMLIPRKLRERAAVWYLRRKPEPDRERRGSNLSGAGSVALLYIDSDETYFKQVKACVKTLHETYGINRVCALGYVALPSKHLPIYHAQRLEYMYFTKSDLNWHLEPKVSLMNFISEPFDVLIDLSLTECLPMQYILKASKARMKVGARTAKSGDLLDLTIGVPEGTTRDAYWNDVIYYLTKPQLR